MTSADSNDRESTDGSEDSEDLGSVAGKAPASLAARLIGRLADLLISVAFGIVIALPARGSIDAGGFSIWAFLAGAAMFVWETSWVAVSGASVGKHLAGTRVTTTTGVTDRVGWGRAAVRATPRLLWGFPIGTVIAVPVGLASLILMAVRSDRRTLADLLAGTHVVDSVQPD